MNTGHRWSEQEQKDLIEAYEARNPYEYTIQFCRMYGAKHGVSYSTVEAILTRMKHDGRIKKGTVEESPYPVYNEPLVMEGDALVLPDTEFPFHNAEFLNRVLTLAQAWKIRQCIFAGDVLHFDSLSGWGSNFTNQDEGGIDANTEKALLDFAMKLGSKKQGEMMELIGSIGDKKEQDGLSSELNVARKELHKIEKLFDSIHFVIGNHCGRLLKALDTTLNPQELLRLVDINNPKWKIAPYYFSYLDTESGRFIIEHPKNAGKFSAGRLAGKYQSHILMAHSHQLNYSFDPSGKFYAIEMGHCVDENRLPYASQRHNLSPAHALGSVIVKNGIPYLLHARTDWKAMERMYK